MLDFLKENIEVKKNISPMWHYFLVFYFFITITIIISLLILSFFYILPYMDYIKEYWDLSIDFFKNHTGTIKSFLAS